jgi:site-specific DNA-cytosine methylase
MKKETVIVDMFCGAVAGERLDIRFRLLTPRELRRAQGFPEDYIITGTRTEQKKQIGNAVPVNMAKALALAAFNKVKTP